MKKLLSILTLMLVVIMAGCNSPASTTEYATLEDLQALETRVNEVETTLDNLVCSVGLNGQVDCYINEQQANTNVYMSLNYYIEMAEKDYLDKTKFPSYIWDLDENYVDINQLSNLLTQKYLNAPSTATTGLQFKIVVNINSNMSNDEFMARLCLMIIELANYDFYTIDSPELYIQLGDGGTQYIKVRMSLLVSDVYNLHPAMIWEEMLDTRIEGINFTKSVVEQYYNDFIANETFTGYVLDYK